MYFKKMSLHGFKSFADPVTIEFDKGITCVVGPNGSGKSNISDALRWVLGEQSAKMLRGGKMDEVIFAGTDKRKSRGMAEVTLVIDNADGSLPIDFTEVSITRRMYRSGDSEYYINNTQCRLRDIRELIMDTGIGVDGYSLIGQGKIAEIISGKPESRREIFEQAAGIKKYRTKRADTERKLESTTHNLERVNDIVIELESRIEPLRIESEKAVEYLDISSRYKENEINVTLKNIEQNEEQRTELLNDIIATDKLINEGEVKKDQLDKDIRSRKDRSEEIDREEFEERDRIMKFNSEMNELRNRVTLNTERISSLDSNIELYAQEKLALEDKLQREENNEKELITRLETLSKDSEAIETKLNECTAQLEAAEAQAAEENIRFNEERDQIYELSLKSSSKGAEITGLMQMGTSLRQRLEAISDLPEDQEDSAAKVSLETGLRKKELLEEEKLNADKKVEKYKLQLQDLIASEEKYTSAQETARLNLGSEKTRKNMLQQLEDSYEGYNGAVRYIMKESDIDGMYGTAGELITVPRGYETAIETALAARMQNIVCRDEECAEKAIRVLKQKKIGRVTFLPADSIRVNPRRSTESIEGAKGYVGVAADCVEFEDRYQKVVEYLLGGIVIVETLENAVKIAKKSQGLKFVTLEGEFINPAGAITGGAHKGNSVGIFDRKNRLSECDSRIAALQADVTAAEEALRKVSESKSEAEENLAAAESESRKIEIDILNLENEINEYRLRVAQFDENLDRQKRELERLEIEISENESAVDALQKEKEQMDAEIEKLKTAAEALLSDTEESRKNITELQFKKTSVRIEAESVRGEMTNVKGLMDIVESRIAEIKADIENKTSAEKNALTEQETLRADSEAIEAEIAVKEQSSAAFSENLRLLREEKEVLTKEIDSLTGEREEKERDLFLHRSKRHELNLKAESIESKIESWKNRLWDEFETSYIQAVEFKKIDFNLNEGIRLSRKLKDALRNLGEVNTGSIAEYKSVKERYEFLTEQRADLIEAITSLRQIIADTDVKIRTSFKSSFDAISMNFEKVFTELFGGGKAELRIDSEEDLLDANIEIVVQPPGKKLQNMNLLSGGEKTMTAIALMFAVLRAKPTPFCVLDEVEAALDEANIERFADYLKKFEDIQFVLVTHQKTTMEHASVLYGVTMPEKGISKILSLRLADAEQLEGMINT